MRQPAELASTRYRAPLLCLRLCARLVLGIAAATTTVLVAPPPAAAQPDEGKAIAVRIEGDGGESIEAAIQAIVPETLTVADPETFQKALKKAGVKVPLGKAISDERQRDKVLPKIRKALKAAKLEAAIFGLMRKSGSKKEVYVIYVDQVAGDLAIDEAITLRGSEADYLRSIDAALGPVLREIAPAESNKPEKIEREEPPPPPPKGEDEGKEEEPAGARVKNQVSTALLVADLGLEFGGRWFSYNQPVTANLRDYGMFGAPLIVLGAELYPFAGTGTSVLKDLGLTLGYARAIGLSSAVEGASETISTTYQRFHVGLRGRMRFGKDAKKAMILGLGGGLRLQQFSFGEAPLLEAELPDVSYTILRLGADFRAPVGPVALLAGFDFFLPLSRGAIYDRFNEASALGIALGGGVAIPITGGIEARAQLEYARFGASFKPREGDAYIAGGALDQFFGLRLGAAYAY